MTTPRRERAIEELLAAARETIAWPFKRPRPFVSRLADAVKSYDEANEEEGADHHDEEEDDPRE